MTTLDEPSFLVLNALYLKKMASAKALVEISGLPADDVRAMVGDFGERGWLMDMGDDLLIQPEGMAQVDQYYRSTYAELSQRDEMAEWYTRFEALNGQFIKLVSDWQQTDGEPRVEERVIKTVERLVKLIVEISHVVPRYGSYVRRFERSVTAIDQGDRDFVCTPTVDSVHNIWFEFHEDFLAVLGRPRDT
jgi:hypothetical protein